MILKQALTQVLVLGVVALSYLQKACCELAESDVQTIHLYWLERLHYIEKEVNLRNKALGKFRNLIPKEMESGLERAKRKMDKMSDKVKELKKKGHKIIEITGSLQILFDQKKCSPSSFVRNWSDSPRIAAERKRLEDHFIPSLLLNTCVMEKLNFFDLHMLDLVEEYSKRKRKNSNLNKMTLFKLAKLNKIMAVNIVYTLFDMEWYKKHTNIPDTLDYMVRNILGHIPHENVELFVSAIATEANRKNARRGELEMLQIADDHFHLLFDKNIPAPDELYSFAMDFPVLSSTDECPARNNIPKKSIVDKATMQIYLSMLDENVSEIDFSKYLNITPAQIMKIIIIECTMKGRLTNYRNNQLFSVLGRVIENMYNPKSNSEYILEGLQMGREKQDRVLDVLSALWDDYNFSNQPVGTDIDSFCEENGITFFDIKRVQKILAHAKWMYEMLNCILEPKHSSFRNEEIQKGSHMNVSYMHPLWYVCNRCEHISDLADRRYTSSAMPFKQIENRKVVLRPYTIKKTKDMSERDKYIQGCIKAWCSPHVEIISREEDGDEHFEILHYFVKYLKNSDRNTVAIKRTKETGECEYIVEVVQEKPAVEEAFETPDILDIYQTILGAEQDLLFSCDPSTRYSSSE
ncbi:hypothetical protein NEMIN01_0356 [Nematocida minor]|uniref:uncharacterized protein n=1 Tax=Nematocida minor TaxID=1912983 RepID=UPI002220455D|nr:uncharacterized protein NEMIN01_0356 [Nematocida minor]KAI5189190.1 hypothetical protein NEMIN01_0356 [Nematocida minor]